MLTIVIHDLNFNPPRVYRPATANDCKGAADRSVFELATQLNSTVTCGKVIAEVQPCTPTVTNKDRAEWARRSVDASQGIINGTVSHHPEDLEDSAKDLIANIIHLCDREGWSFEDMVESAAMHHSEETRTEEVQS